MKDTPLRRRVHISASDPFLTGCAGLMLSGELAVLVCRVSSGRPW